MKTKTHLLSLLLLLWACSSASAGYMVLWGPDTPVLDANDYFVDVAIRQNYLLALKLDGSLVAWKGETGSSAEEWEKYYVPPGNDFVKIAIGAYHQLALKSNGSLVAWNFYYDMPQDNDFIDIAAGGLHNNLAIKLDGSLVSWGEGDKICYGEYNDPNDPNDPNVGCVPSGFDFVSVAVGIKHSLALRSDGSIAAWGDNTYGQCDVPEGKFTVIDAGPYSNHSLAMKEDGSIAAWGKNDYGQCDVSAGNFVAIAGGSLHSVAIKSDGTLVAWGSNSHGQHNVPIGNAYGAIAAETDYSVALTSGQTVKLTVQTEPNDMNSVIPGIGEHNYYPGQRIFINAPPCLKCPWVYRFDHWTGDVSEPNSPFGYLTMDADKTITAIYAIDPVRICGDECHPILQGDHNEDCRIDFDDFAIYCAQWLNCTHPDCDEL